MKILFICESYYENASPNGICVQKVAEHLAKSNDVYVCTYFNGTSQKDYSNFNKVNIYRTNMSRINRKIYFGSDRIRKKYLFVSKINGFFHCLKYPFLSRSEVNNLSKMSIDLNKKEHFDYCITVYHKIHPVLAGIKLKQTDSNIKLILYSLDSISGGWIPTIARSKKIPLNSLIRWEKVFFSKYDYIFAMNSHKQHYESNNKYTFYLNKIEYVDIPLLDLSCTNKKNTQKSNYIHLLYTGSLYSYAANPKYFLKLFQYLPQNYIFDIYGNIDGDLISLFDKRLLDSNRIVFHKFVSHDMIKGLQQNCDALLNFGNSNPNMIPCKIFEYISSGNKIISFKKSNQDSSFPYLSKYNNCLIVEENDNAILENAKKIIDFINAEIKVDMDLKDKFKMNLPEYFEKVLFQLEKRNG